MPKKYVLTDEVKWIGGHKLHRIKAIVSFGDVVCGELGGYIEKEINLSHEGHAWIYNNAKICGDAEVYGNAKVYGNATVWGDAEVYGDASVCGRAEVGSGARIYNDARVYGDARVGGDAIVYGNAEVYDAAGVYGRAEVGGDAMVYGDATVSGISRVYGDAELCGNAMIWDNSDYVTVRGFGSRYRATTFFRTKDGGIGVKCGCFYGSLDAFQSKCIETHGNNKYSKEYRDLAALIAFHFSAKKPLTLL